MEETFLNNIDKQKVTDLLNQTEENVTYFRNVTDQVVESYTKPLDDIMKAIYNDIVIVEDPPLQVLEKYFLELTNTLYFVSENYEKLGIYKSLSDAAYKEVYDRKYLDEASDKGTDRKSKKTVAEITSIANSAAIYESATANIYERAYAIVKTKLSNAQTMVSTLSKIISSRMTETQIAMTSASRPKTILNEGE